MLCLDLGSLFLTSLHFKLKLGILITWWLCLSVVGFPELFFECKKSHMYEYSRTCIIAFMVVESRYDIHWVHTCIY